MRLKYLALEDRLEIAKRYQEGESYSDIAKKTDFHLSTIYAEIERGKTGNVLGDGRVEYDPYLANQRAEEGLRRRGNRKKKLC